MNILTIWSVVLGLVTSLVPNYVFRRVLFKRSAHTPKQVVNSLYLAAVLKFLCLIVLFSVILNLPMINTKIYFISFVSVEVSRWLLGYYRLLKAN